LLALQYAHFTYFYHDWVVGWPDYNRTLAHYAWAYDVYTGNNTYLQMQQSPYYKSTTGANKWVLHLTQQPASMQIGC
jgi:hypothetical protein